MTDLSPLEQIDREMRLMTGCMGLPRHLCDPAPEPPGEPIFVLLLNDMRAPKVEYVEPVARASSRAALEAFLERERVPHYRDGRWGKSFRQGGPLEWFNPAYRGDGVVEVMSPEEAGRRAEAEARAQLDAIPLVESLSEAT